VSDGSASIPPDVRRDTAFSGSSRTVVVVGVTVAVTVGVRVAEGVALAVGATVGVRVTVVVADAVAVSVDVGVEGGSSLVVQAASVSARNAASSEV
jgi:hypothetical protein